MSALVVTEAGPGLTLQDLGRPGHLAQGLSRGGAADRMALYEGAALLGQSPALAALEMAGIGGTFRAEGDLRIALTGAGMRASLDGAVLRPNACHALPDGAILKIGPAETGSYCYLHAGGGFDAPEMLGSRSAHLAAGLGARIAGDTTLPVGKDRGGPTGVKLDLPNRLDGGTVRIVPSLQTGLFEPDEIARFEATTFRKDARGNRMGVRIMPDGAGFGTKTGLTVLSEVIVPGDIQITGDGTPFVLMSECQTTGGYPRIGSVIPSDLPVVAQAQAGQPLRFRFVTLAEAVAIERRETTRLAGLPRAVSPIIRDPALMPDLLSYQLISGAVAGYDDEGVYA